MNGYYLLILRTAVTRTILAGMKQMKELVAAIAERKLYSASRARNQNTLRSIR